VAPGLRAQRDRRGWTPVITALCPPFIYGFCVQGESEDSSSLLHLHTFSQHLGYGASWLGSSLPLLTQIALGRRERPDCPLQRLLPGAVRSMSH